MSDSNVFPPATPTFTTPNIGAATATNLTITADTSTIGITIGRYSSGFPVSIIDTGGTSNALELRLVGVAVADFYATTTVVYQPTSIATGATATSALTVGGGIATPIVTVTGNTTLGATHSTIINNRAATNTLTLPAASTCVGRKYHIVTIQAQTVVSASSNVVPRVGGAASTAILPATDGAWATIQSDGSNWIIIASGV